MKAVIKEHGTVILVLVAICHSALPESIDAAQRLVFKQNDVVVFMGGTDMVRAQREGYLEALITKQYSTLQLKFRDLAWEADTVFQQGTVAERWRRGGFGDLNAQLRRIGASVILAQFGKMECLAGPDGLNDFNAGYEQLLERLSDVTQRIVLISPTRFEKPADPGVPDLTTQNAGLRQYANVIRTLAQRRNLPFVDLLNSIDSIHGPLTIDGIHVRDSRQGIVAAEIARQLGISIDPDIEELRLAVLEKNRLWNDYWRPANWKCLFGDDARRNFSRGGEGAPTFQDEWKSFPALIEQAEIHIAKSIATMQWEQRATSPVQEPLYGTPEADITKELSAFEPLTSLQVNLFASDALGIRNPLAMRWDTNGRLYVACSDVYPQIKPGQRPNDRIVVLEDENGDGTADKSTVFARGLNIPTGLELGHGGVYVGQATELLFLKDTNGDGRADERRVLLSGFGNGDSHQTINSFIWSPGGELYFCQGDGIESRVETPWGISGLYQAGVFRLRPGRLQLHGLLDDFMGPGNPWGVAFDDWGQGFVVDGAGGISFLTPAMLPTSHHLSLPTIGEPGGYCGVDVLSGRHLPAEVHGDFVLGDFKRNTVARFAAEPRGAGFEVVWKDPLLRSSHRNFRPVDIKVGPDGAVYIADWYNPITCHQDDFFRHPERDKAHGRIWRISAKNREPLTRPRLTDQSIPTLLDGLQSTERWTRNQVKRELSTRGLAEVASKLRAWVASLNPQSERYQQNLFEALTAFESLEIVETKLLSRVLTSNDHRMRAYAARVVGRWHDRLDNPLELLSHRVVDQHPLVRMEAMLAIGAIPESQSVVVAAHAADHPVDQWIDYALTQSVHHLKPHWLGAFKRGEVVFETTGQLAAVLNRVGSEQLLSTLRELADSDELDAKARAAVVAGILSIGDESDLRGALEPGTFTHKGRYDADAHADALLLLLDVHQARGMRPSGDLAQPLRRLLGSEHERLETAVYQLMGSWQVASLQDELIRAATKARAATSVQRAAIVALGQLGGGESLTLLEELALSGPIEMRAAAVEGLAESDLPAAARHATTLLNSLEHSHQLSASLFSIFLKHRDGSKELAEALASSQLTRSVAESGLWALYSAGRTDEQLMRLCKKAAGLDGPVPPYDPELIQTLAEDTWLHGDANRGKTIFSSAALGCATCHKVDNTVAWVGPDLSAVGTTMPLPRIIEEVLWPARQVKEGYTLTSVTTEDGKIVQGYERKQKEASEELLLMDVTTARLKRIPTARIEVQQEAGTPMPSGLTSGLTRSQMLDLFRYLTSLGTTR